MTAVTDLSFRPDFRHSHGCFSKNLSSLSPHPLAPPFSGVADVCKRYDDVAGCFRINLNAANKRCPVCRLHNGNSGEAADPDS